MPPHLYRRDDDKSANYYVRLIAPKALHPLLSPRERQYRQSTGTADLGKARVIGAEMIARKRREWDELLALQQAHKPTRAVSLTEQLIQQIAGARLVSWIETDNFERLGDEGLDDAHLNAIEEFCALSDQKMRGVLAQGRGSPHWAHAVADILEWCEDLGYEVSKTDALFPQLVRAYAKSERDAQRFISGRNQGEEPAVELILPKAGTRLSEVAPLYEAQKAKSVSKKSVSKNVSIWSRLVRFLDDTFIDEVRSADIYRFLEDRLFSDKEPWSQAYVDGHGKRALREVFAFARTMGLMTAQNPVADLETTPKLPKNQQKTRSKERFPFSTEQINQLFASDWYRPRSAYFKGKLADDLAARYWPPLIGLLHGCRVREYMQLVTSDVIVVEGIDCLHFQVDIDALEKEARDDGASAHGAPLPVRTVKSECVIRRVPIHPKLIELGFLEFVEERRRAGVGAVPLFWSALPEPDGKTPVWGRSFEQGFGRFLKTSLRMPRGYHTHSFRHQFEDRIRASQARDGVWPAGLGQFLSGRKLPRDADREIVRQEGSERLYGAGYTPMDVVPYQNRLKFDGIVFPMPFGLWRGGASDGLSGMPEDN